MCLCYMANKIGNMNYLPEFFNSPYMILIMLGNIILEKIYQIGEDLDLNLRNSTPPFETINLYHGKMLSISSEDTDYSMLNDVEEAAVIKSFGPWYQKQYSNKFPNGRER